MHRVYRRPTLIGSKVKKTNELFGLSMYVTHSCTTQWNYGSAQLIEAGAIKSKVQVQSELNSTIITEGLPSGHKLRFLVQSLALLRFESLYDLFSVKANSLFHPLQVGKWLANLQWISVPSRMGQTGSGRVILTPHSPSVYKRIPYPYPFFHIKTRIL